LKGIAEFLFIIFPPKISAKPQPSYVSRLDSNIMAEFQNPETTARGEFIYPRLFMTYPKLPPGYDWARQISKYSGQFSVSKIAGIATKPDPKFEDRPEEFYRTGYPLLNGRTRRKKQDKNFNRLSAVFAHRGFYDRAMKIPENSTAAIDNGLYRGIWLHELDVRFGPNPGEAFLAHDQTTFRVTAKNDRWSSLSLGEILDTEITARRYDFSKKDFASSYEETGTKIPELREVLSQYEDLAFSHNRGCTFQLDLRGDDFARAVAWFRNRRASRLNLLLKGYNNQYASGQQLEQAIAKYPSENEWENLPVRDRKVKSSFKTGLVFIFYPIPIVDLALKAKGIPKTWDGTTVADRMSLSYELLCSIAEQHFRSFMDARMPERYPRMILEIVYNGIGLGYNIKTGEAVDPRNHEPIIDEEVVFESRLDRAMLDVALKLRREYPQMMFSSCTRLCDVRTPDGVEYRSNYETGRLVQQPVGDKGIARQLRGIHGGLYPQTDVVVADDPIAEIAARTWIDEYAKLNRAELLYKSWDEWLKQGGEDLVEAVREINGPFLPNTCEMVVD